MNRLLITCLLLFVITGCSDSKLESGPAFMAAKDPAPNRGNAADGARRTLAYEHSIQIDTPEDKVAAVHGAALAACHEASADLCEVLDSRINTGSYVSASLKLRAKPEGIQKLIEKMSKQAEITSQSTQAEDLAGPLQDGEKKIAMLTAYRADLETLRKRPGIDVDALIKVTRELAEVQSALEAANGTQARLVRRVETEILNITVQSVHAKSFWRPISLALSDFGSSLAHGISTAITGVAYLLPWSLVIGLVVWVARKLWRRRKQQ